MAFSIMDKGAGAQPKQQNELYADQSGHQPVCLHAKTRIRLGGCIS